jgi:hypothetical protein
VIGYLSMESASEMQHGAKERGHAVLFAGRQKGVGALRQHRSGGETDKGHG